MNNTKKILNLIEDIKKVGPFEWATNSRDLFFLTNRKGTLNIWKTSPDFKDPLQMTYFDSNISSLKVSPDGKKVAFLADTGGSERYELFLSDIEFRDIKKIDTEWTIEFPDFSWAPDSERIVYIAKKAGYYNLYIISVNSGKVEQITDTPEFKRDPGWSGKGNFIAFFSMEEKQRGHVAVLSTENGKIVKITEGLKGVNSYPRWSPLSDTLLFVSDGKGMKRLGIISFPEKDLKWLPFDGYEENLPEWSPDGKKILYISNINGIMKLFIYHIKEDKREDAGFSTGVTSSGRWSPDGKLIAFRHHNFEKPADIYVTDGKEIRQVTFNLSCELPYVGGAEQVYYKSFDNKDIPAFLYSPSEKGPHPAVIWVHGGPASQHFNGWEPLFHLLLSAGIAVLAPNIRGSTGKGRDYEYAIYRDWGGADLQDIIYGVRYLRELDRIRPEKIAVGGASYGGFMTMTALVKYPDLWACGINSIGPVNLGTFYIHTSRWLRELLINKYGFKSPEEDRDFYYERSPVNFIDELKAPLLLIYSDDDVRVPRIEMEQLLDRLKEYGKEFDLVLFSDEGHSSIFSKHELKRYRLILDFLKKHLMSEG